MAALRDSLPPDGMTSPCETEQIRSGSRARTGDELAREEPLEIQLGPAALAVVMRTPGHDEELTRGFLLTERVVRTSDDIQAIRHCTTAPSREAEDNVIRVTLQPNVLVDLEALRRNLYASSSCGICGKATIENALSVAPPLTSDLVIATSVVESLPAKLRDEQPVFSRTGGLHAAGLFTATGELLAVREDVGRHNAVDKLVGWAATRQLLPLDDHVLMVSGRISFEIVQKALSARIPVIAAISAPTSLAVEMATHANMALVGFLRPGAMNLYGATSRIKEAPVSKIEGG